MNDYSKITNISVALSNAVGVGLMSREQATGIWKKLLVDEGLIKPIPKFENPKSEKIDEVKKEVSK